MARKEQDLAYRVAGGLAAMAAGIAARKVITFGWKRVTGKEPPSDPDSPEVQLREALAWAVLMGVGMEVARLLAVRATAKKMTARANRDIPGIKEL